ncbi:phosphatase PAP2 family protein [Stratiformator vulcanicus]|uniref:PAP2 superfamily protein n=1 Tax=Stratiformator vulcanicus TaxID=2527980 RepID=A0A517QZZ4_9PLAN|nr:phosphatase PAP2 family protein [Stratiformator vulcanicus]QDT37144.1 PAP2 superfamily protein [Stratiformator vulcanicus]
MSAAEPLARIESRPSVSKAEEGASAATLPWWGLPSALLVAAVVVAPYDVVLSNLLFKQEAAHIGLLRTILNNIEPFGHGVGVVAIALVVFALEALPTKQRLFKAWAVLSTAAGAGISADILKLFVGRIRPRNYDFANLSTSSTFVDWLPGIASGGAPHSFPSAHSATAAGLAVILTYYYPKGRGLFALFTVLVVGHRINSGAHFPSDVLVGLSVGLLFGTLCTKILIPRFEPKS